jgi:hypothetical protein
VGPCSNCTALNLPAYYLHGGTLPDGTRSTGSPPVLLGSLEPGSGFRQPFLYFSQEECGLTALIHDRKNLLEQLGQFLSQLNSSKIK